MPKKKVYDVRCECFKDIPVRGLLHIMILNLLMKKRMCGAEIHSSLRDKFHIDTPKPIIYNLLRRLEKSGYLRSKWDTRKGPPKRIYEITEEGIEYYKKVKVRLNTLRKIIERLI